MNIKPFAGLAILALCLGCAAPQRQGDDPPFDLANFKCPNWLPTQDIYERTIARPNLTIAIVASAREHEPFSQLCLSPGCLSRMQDLQYSFRKMQLIQNGQEVKPNSRFAVLYETNYEQNKVEGFRLDPSKRYLILVASGGIQGRGEFSLNAACELAD